MVGRVVFGGFAEVEESVAKLLAVGESDGVGPSKGHHFLYVEFPSGEVVYDLGQGHAGPGEVTFDGLCF